MNPRRHFAATDLTAVVIPNSGSWLMADQPIATISAIQSWLEKSRK